MTDPGPYDLEEASLAFWVASYAQDVVKQFIEAGHPDGEDFVSLCHAIRELEMGTVGALPFGERAEELHQLDLERKKSNGAAT